MKSLHGKLNKFFASNPRPSAANANNNGWPPTPIPQQFYNPHPKLADYPKLTNCE
jgi:hypothetical protein